VDWLYRVRDTIWFLGRDPRIKMTPVAANNSTLTASTPAYGLKDTCSFAVCVPPGTSTTTWVPLAVTTVR
jgi:hypothetical protein